MWSRGVWVILHFIWVFNLFGHSEETVSINMLNLSASVVHIQTKRSLRSRSKSVPTHNADNTHTHTHTDRHTALRTVVSHCVVTEPSVSVAVSVMTVGRGYTIPRYLPLPFRACDFLLKMGSAVDECRVDEGLHIIAVHQVIQCDARATALTRPLPRSLSIARRDKLNMEREREREREDFITLPRLWLDEEVVSVTNTPREEM